MWEDPADRILMIDQLQRGGPIRNVITRLGTKSGEIKLTAYSADKYNSTANRASLRYRKTCLTTTSER